MAQRHCWLHIYQSIRRSDFSREFQPMFATKVAPTDTNEKAAGRLLFHIQTHFSAHSALLR